MREDKLSKFRPPIIWSLALTAPLCFGLLNLDSEAFFLLCFPFWYKITGFEPN